MSSPSTDAPQSVTILRSMAGALIGAPVVILIAMAVVLSPRATTPIPWVLIGVVVLLGALCAVAAATIGYRIPPLAAAPEDDVRAQAYRAFMTALFRRFALCYPVVLVSIALGVTARTGGIFVVGVGVLIGIGLALVHVWPSERVVARSEQALEAGGVRSELREALGMTPRPPGFLA